MINGLSKDIVMRLFTIMQTIREVEERVAFVYPEQEIKCPVHLCTGQEAIAAGVCIQLKKEDTIFSTHRSHGHCIAKGMGLKTLIAEIYGRVTGCSRGKGGSMHLVDPENGIPGTSAIVGGSLPLAVGAALASVLQRKDRVSIAFFGDGAVDEGVFHESLNFASLKKLPVVFVCENNNYATNSPRSARQPDVEIASRAACYGMPGIAADGNDVFAVYRAAEKAITEARTGGGPTLLEFTTYRWKGHVGPLSDIETGSRPADEHESWLKRCPIEAFSRKVLDTGSLSRAEMDRICAEIRQNVNDAMEFAKASPLPGPEEMMDHVF